MVDALVARGVPDRMETGEMRLRQLLRNVLSNALKFTDKGWVRLTISVPERAEWSVDNDALNNASTVIAFAVSDSGIGVAKDKQKIIFEPFQQADGGTSRKYGGTGLGLAISREIAGLLGGELRIQSEPNVGSTFTLYIPDRYQSRSIRPLPMSGASFALARGHDGHGQNKNALSTREPLQLPAASPAADDRQIIRRGDRVLLVIEDDEVFGRVLLDLVREHGFRGVVAKTGAQGLQFARTLQPHAITLDLRLPDMDGFVVLDQLKHNESTRHIPVHVISAADDAGRGLQYGAIAFLQKPVSGEALEEAMHRIEGFLERQVKHLLVVEDDDRQRASMVDLIGVDEDVNIVGVDSGEAAIQALSEQTFDCMVLDLKLPGMSGLELIQRVKDNEAWRRTPIIVYTGKELTREEDTELRRLTDTIIVKDVKSPERLLDETALFLHRVESKLPSNKRQMLRRLSETDPALRGKRVLVVDDDARNLFAITTILEQHEMLVTYAENGQQALDRLAQASDAADAEGQSGFDIVLMDIMMPEMDGYEATRRIRAQPQHEKLPIIALTAKAMQGDREKCIQAGASDYITKPVDSDQLLSLLRVWLYR